MSAKNPDFESYADHAARLVGLDLPPEYRAAVVQNIGRAAKLAESLLATPISDDTPWAPEFEP
jgi:hypothetical protein